MASLRQKPRSPFWIACYTASDGRQLQRSTKMTDRRKAQAMANAFEEAEKLGKNKRLGEAQARKVLSGIYEKLNDEPLPSSSVHDYLNAWAKRRASDTAPRTAEAYSQIVRDFLKSLGPRAAIDISQVSKKDVVKFRDATLVRTSISTANKALKYVRIPLGAAWKEGFSQDNPAAKVELLKDRKADKAIRRGFTEAEIRVVLANAAGEWRGLVLFGYFTGQRLRDIASLTWQNVDLQARVLRFTTQKTGRRMEIDLHSALVSHLESLPTVDDPNAPLFPESHAVATKPKADSRLSQQFHRILVSSGFATARRADHASEGTGRTSKRPVAELSFHSLRHSATSALKNAGAAELVVRDLIGHDSELVSRGYSHVDAKAKRTAIDSLPDVTLDPNVSARPIQKILDIKRIIRD